MNAALEPPSQEWGWIAPKHPRCPAISQANLACTLWPRKRGNATFTAASQPWGNGRDSRYWITTVLVISR